MKKKPDYRLMTKNNGIGLFIWIGMAVVITVMPVDKLPGRIVMGMVWISLALMLLMWVICTKIEEKLYKKTGIVIGRFGKLEHSSGNKISDYAEAVLISMNQFGVLNNPQFEGKTQPDSDGQYRMYWSCGGEMYYTINQL